MRDQNDKSEKTIKLTGEPQAVKSEPQAERPEGGESIADQGDAKSHT